MFSRGIEIKSRDQIDKMRVAGLLTGQTLELLREAARPGVTTGELDKIAEDNIRSHGGVPSFLGYGYPPFPATICASVNDEVVHGIPGERVLAEGDVISIDCGAIVDGWHGDSAITVAVGGLETVPDDVRRLLEVTEESLWRGMAAARLGGRLTDISHGVEGYIRSQGDYGILEDYVGHGIGTAMHQPPNVPNVGRPGRGPKLVEGLALAVEPMVTLGGSETDLLEDEWTVATSDGSLAAHFEHTFTLTPNGPWVLTALDGGQAKLEELGVPFGGR
ncbi:type I methionyl aminopeptidase [Nocardioides agariphilus]|jgi:methionyl aminopeptidase|uniref:Methionine aminopeptidase n=1 Tax=Nocardioides agariphilus TaxID=433664 RepID=A0A930VTH0_9ACTN|nr:type I methionyl aminopeptidase [Nocardioides agariphilus]MBF4770377.1 type I methionyl aminopeptidase [Nocardioides agariphilus]